MLSASILWNNDSSNFFDYFLQAETAQAAACEQFEAISVQAKEELLDFKTRRLHAFRKRYSMAIQSIMFCVLGYPIKSVGLIYRN